MKTSFGSLFVAHESNAWPTIFIGYQTGIEDTFDELLDCLCRKTQIESCVNTFLALAEKSRGLSCEFSDIRHL